MARLNDGGPAHPRSGYWPDMAHTDREDLHAAIATQTEPQYGMTLRDWFAGKALMGLLAAHTGEQPLPNPDDAAATAYDYATAMVTAKERVMATELVALQAEMKRRREAGELDY